MKKIEEKKILQCAIIKNKLILMLIIAVTLIVGVICFPWNLKKLLVHSNTSTIEIMRVGTHEQEVSEITLNEYQKDELLSLFENSYVRLKVFHKNSVTEKFMGYYIILPDNSDIVYYFSEDIISINGTQYKVYGKTLASKFKSIIESEK